MHTKIIKIESETTDIGEAAELIRAGELVAFPTETVYGLGADALKADAARKIYAAKGRPSDNPLIVHIADFSQMEYIAAKVPKEAKILADAFWPGPITLIVPKNGRVPYETTGGMDTVAVRMPNHPVALRLIRESGRLIAAPSANRSGKPSPTEAGHVFCDLDGRIPLILDGGAVGIGLESTIVDLTEGTPMILRPGYINKAMLEEALHTEVKLDPGLAGADSVERPKAPGMKYKHYAPDADLIVLEGKSADVVETINALVLEMKEAGKKTGVIAASETRERYRADHVVSIGAREDEDAIARHLYKLLREFDALRVDVIYSESFQTPRIGQAIMNRLVKAAGHQVIKVEKPPERQNERNDETV